MVWNVDPDPERRTITELPHQIRTVEHVWIPMSDGTRLAARIWLPVDAEQNPVPAILEYIPYRKNDFTAIRDSLRHPYFAGHGYASVRVDMRGSGDSDGLLLDEYLKQEQDDAIEVIEWLGQQPWCTGAVGMIGKSWGGFNGLQVAARQPQGLKTVVTLCSTDDRYDDDVHYRGGAILGADMLYWASTMLAFNARPPEPEVVGDGWREQWLERMEKTPPFVETWLEHQTRDGYWQHGSIRDDYSAVKVPVFAVGGWLDGYTNPVFRMLENLPGPVKGLVGPWAHEYPEVAEPGPRIGFLQECVRWFDQWLKGIDTGVMDEPQLRVWLQESYPPSTAYPVRREGRWVEEESWPTPRVNAAEYYLTEAGLRTSPGAAGELIAAPVASHGEWVGEWCPFGDDGDLPGDQRAEDGVSLTFDTPPLSERVEVLGFPELTLEVASDRPEALLAVRLCDVAPDGSSTLVSNGVLNLTHRNGHENPEPLEPGMFYRVSLKLDALGHALPEGHRWRLAVAPHYWPRLWSSPAPASLRVRLGEESVLRMPVRTAPYDEEVRPFGPPETTPVLEVESLRDGWRKRTVNVDQVTGERVMIEASDTGLSLLKASGHFFDTISRDTYTVDGNDPSRVSARCERSITVGKGEWETRVETDSSMTCDRENFYLVNSLRAFEGEEQVFEKEWRKTVPRRLV